MLKLPFVPMVKSIFFHSQWDTTPLCKNFDGHYNFAMENDYWNKMIVRVFPFNYCDHILLLTWKWTITQCN